MRNLLFIVILLMITSTAMGQWEEDFDTKSKKKQYKEAVEYEKTGKVKNSSQPELSKDASQALITNFDAALQRRLFAMKSTAKHDESYWEIMEAYYHFLRKSYDKHLYNVIALNDQVWVEPQYITAMFNGSDPAQGMNDYIEVLFKKKQIESRKEESYYWGRYNSDWYYWDRYYWDRYYWGYGPWYPWNPWNPWNPWGPWGPWGPYGPWGPTIIVVDPHPIYYGNHPGGSDIFSPSPSLRIEERFSEPGDPFGRKSAAARVETRGNIARERLEDRSYRDNYPSNNYRNNSSVGSFGGGFGGGGGFHSIGGGGRRR